MSTRVRRAAPVLGLLPVAAVLVAVAGPPGAAPPLVVGAGEVGSAALMAGAFVAIRRAAHLERADPTSPWHWFARAFAAVGLGTAVGGVGTLLHSGPTPADWVQATHLLSGTVAAILAYQGVVRWNRFRTGVVSPADWINGTSAVLAAAAVLQAATAGVARIDALGLLPSLCVGASLVVVTTMLTVLNLASLRRDPRFWAVLATMTVVASGQVLACLHPGQAGLRTAAWTLAALAAVAWIGSQPGRRRGQLYPASGAATAGGAITILVASLATLLVESSRAAAGGAQAVDHADARALAGLAAAGALIRLGAMVRDRSLLAMPHREARVDELTGLGNRRALSEHLTELESRGRPASLILVDLDDFKEVNDRHGHPAGDHLLRSVARCLEHTSAAEGRAYRMGGDEFAVVASASADAACLLARQITRALDDLRPPATGRGVRASLGLASGRASATELLHRADIALYAAKGTADPVVLYDEQLGAAADDRRRLVDDLRCALADDADDTAQIVVWYQPKLTARRQRVCGLEALVRWQHPTRGLVPPGAFLPLADELGLMPALTERVLRAACAWTATWNADRRRRTLSIAVNVAPTVLADPGVVDLVTDALRASGLAPGALVLEVTEETLIEPGSPARANAARLSELGIAISIDDYGTGYSSLAQLHRMPAAELKLDRALTRDLRTDHRAREIVSATIDLAHRLHLRVVAEGVEDHLSHALLTALGVDQVQGWVHAEAMPPDAVERWLDSHHEPAGPSASGPPPVPSIPAAFTPPRRHGASAGR